jgi:phosphoenolpyruvate synthase/pyruvate phosphate dikinase
MTKIQFFKNIARSDVLQYGGKGASLGEMFNTSIPVPNGFVVGSSIFQEALKKDGLLSWIETQLETLDIQDVSKLNNLSNKIQDKIIDLKLDESFVEQITNYFEKLDCSFVAVRSSATAEDGAEDAWAGQLSTFLNVKKENLLDSIKKCWASLFTPRALTYRFEKKLSNDISVAVVVQKMVASEKSGVAFSTHPITQEKNTILIEAGFGLGEAVVSGEITPDSYNFNKQSKQIKTVVSNKQSKQLVRGEKGDVTWIELNEKAFPILTNSEIEELSSCVMRIEKHYGFPVDVEWAFENNTLYIIQARPITTLSDSKKTIVQTFLDLVDGEDVFQCMDTNIFPETVVWTKRTFLKEFYESKTPLPFIIIMRKEQSIAYYQKRIWDDIGEEFTRLYFNEDAKATKAIELFLSDKKNMDELYEEYSYEKIQQTSFSELQELIPRIMSLMEPKFFSDTSKEFCKQFLTDLTDEQIDEIWLFGTNPICESFDARQKRIVCEDLVVGEDIVKNLEKYQYFFTGLTTVLNLENTKEKIKSEFNISKNEAIKHLDSLETNDEKEKFNKKYSLLNEKQKFVVDFIQQMIELRDLRKDIHTKGITLFYRIAITHIFEPLGIEEKYLQYISYDELLQPVDYFEKNKDEIKTRISGYGLLVKNEGTAHNEMLDFDSSKIILNNYIDKDLSDANIEGNVACKGIVVGKVRVITSIQEQSNDFEDGEILVTGMARPEYLPLARKASAIITDEGGVTSHAAIIARELNKPCIIGTNNATRRLKTGDLIEVNADKGYVRKVN